MKEKLKSRKLFLVIFWCMLSIFCLVVHMVTGLEPSYTGNVITFTGTVSAAYMAMQGYIDSKKEDVGI